MSFWGVCSGVSLTREYSKDPDLRQLRIRDLFALSMLKKLVDRKLMFH